MSVYETSRKELIRKWIWQIRVALLCTHTHTHTHTHTPRGSLLEMHPFDACICLCANTDCRKRSENTCMDERPPRSWPEPIMHCDLVAYRHVHVRYEHFRIGVHIHACRWSPHSISARPEYFWRSFSFGPAGSKLKRPKYLCMHACISDRPRFSLWQAMQPLTLVV
jgi:hypothetical protein